jgi:hypothetical protein
MKRGLVTNDDGRSCCRNHAIALTQLVAISDQKIDWPNIVSKSSFLSRHAPHDRMLTGLRYSMQHRNGEGKKRRMWMSLDRAKAFLETWLRENVHDAVRPESNMEARHLARLCLKAAADQGITKAELEEVAGEDLVSCMMDAQVATADAVAKDN